MEKKVIKIKETDNWPNTTRLEMIERSEVYDKPVLYQYGYYDGYQKCYKRLKADNEILLNALKPLVNLAKEVFIDSRKDKTGTLYGFNKAEITYNDLRTALEAIKQAENK